MGDSIAKRDGSVIRHFSPAWYAAVMGTGGLVNALWLAGGQIPALRSAASGLFWLNLVLFLLFLVPWTLRWLLHFDRLREDLRNPIMSNFFVTMPVGAILVGASLMGAGSAWFDPGFVARLDLVVWAVSALLILGFGVYVVYSSFLREGLQPEHLNFSWFITPVASIVLPLLGTPLAKAWLGSSPELAALVELVDLVFYGIGFFLFLLIGAVAFGNFFQHRLPPAGMAPSFWILLGPIGVGSLSLLGLADLAKTLGWLADPGPLELFATIIWGFGLWAFILTLVLTLRYLRSGGIPFTLSWWAFIFPLAAYTIATFAVGGYTGLAAVKGYGLVLLFLLALLWLLVAVKSMAGVLVGGLLVPRPKQGGRA